MVLSLLAAEVDLATVKVECAAALAPGETVGDPKTRIADVTRATVPHPLLIRKNVLLLR